MKKIYFNLSLLLFLIMKSMVASAQTTPEETTAKEKPKFKFGVYYNTHLNYFGRTDSLRSSGLFPLAELWFTKSFYINAAPIFVNNSSQPFQYAGSIATIGYRHTTPSNKMIAHVFFVKPFYQDNIQLPQTALKGQGAFTLKALNKILNVTGGADIKFSNGTDLGATGGVDRIFKFKLDPKTSLVAVPSAFVYAGSQRFTESYYRSTGIPGLNQLVTKNTTRFTVLSYEFSVPLVLSIGKTQVIAIPAYVLPQNLVQIEGRPDLSERGENLFYATLGLKYNF